VKLAHFPQCPPPSEIGRSRCNASVTGLRGLNSIGCQSAWVQELLEAAAATGPDRSPSDDAPDQQQPTGVQRQQQSGAQRSVQRQPDALSSSLVPELSLATSLSLVDQGVKRQGVDEEGEVSSIAAGSVPSDRHDEAFEFRRRPSATSDTAHT
jgi:hypothetical protein